jgi:predicted DNA-binding ribbon-helix-helix protein
LADGTAIVLAEVVNRLLIGHKPAHEPHHLDIVRSIVIAGHKTSVSLEDAFWKGLKEIAVERNKTLSDVVAEIDTGRPHGNLSSAIRCSCSTITGQKPTVMLSRAAAKHR